MRSWLIFLAVAVLSWISVPAYADSGIETQSVEVEASQFVDLAVAETDGKALAFTSVGEHLDAISRGEHTEAIAQLQRALHKNSGVWISWRYAYLSLIKSQGKYSYG